MGLAPVARTSLAQWFTMSAPKESYRPISLATRTLVPTPSMVEARTGSVYPARA